MKPCTFVVLLNTLLLTSRTLDFACGAMMQTGKFYLTVQGKDRCPDPSSTRLIVVEPARSRVDCAVRCRLHAVPECTSHAYYRSKKLCSLYAPTPDSLLQIPDCSFMLIPNEISSTSLLVQQRTTLRIVDSNGCSLPFQYKYKEYNGCINVDGIDIPQCAVLNGTLVDCTFPPGYIAKQDVINVTMGTSIVPLPCINNWIIMMNRFDGSVDFNRSWEEYKMGFGDIRTSEFWIGNENIHLYTNKPGASYRLRVEFQGYTSGKWFFVEYATFWIGSETKKYAIHLSGFVGNGGDSLTNTSVDSIWYQNGMKFSTSDADNDLKSGGSCASQYASGWWFNNCWWSCLTCVYGTADFSWYTLHDYNMENQGKLGAARMMIRSN